MLYRETLRGSPIYMQIDGVAKLPFAHLYPVSMIHDGEHPSPDIKFPSSQSSGVTRKPSPQAGLHSEPFRAKYDSHIQSPFESGVP